MRSIETFLEENARRYGFWYGVQSSTEAAIRLEREGDRYAANRLTDPEFSLFLDLNHPRRKAEWLAGRLAAKQALDKVERTTGGATGVRPPNAVPGYRQDGEASVLSLPNGAPFFDRHPELRLSLSHSHDLAVAVISTAAIGVDLEKIEPRPIALARHFLCPEERRWIEAPSQPLKTRDEKITWLWSRKEAVSKFLGLGGRMEFTQINALSDLIQIEGLGQVIRLISGSYEGYCLSLAL